MASYLEETLNKWGITSRPFGGSDFAIRFDVRIEIPLSSFLMHASLLAGSELNLDFGPLHEIWSGLLQQPPQIRYQWSAS